MKNCYWSRRCLHNWLLIRLPYVKDYYKVIARDLNIQQALDGDSRAIQQINFTANRSCRKNKDVFHS